MLRTFTTSSKSTGINKPANNASKKSTFTSNTFLENAALMLVKDLNEQYVKVSEKSLDITKYKGSSTLAPFFFEIMPAVPSWNVWEEKQSFSSFDDNFLRNIPHDVDVIYTVSDYEDDSESDDDKIMEANSYYGSSFSNGSNNENTINNDFDLDVDTDATLVNNEDEDNFEEIQSDDDDDNITETEDGKEVYNGYRSEESEFESDDDGSSDDDNDSDYKEKEESTKHPSFSKVFSKSVNSKTNLPKKTKNNLAKAVSPNIQRVSKIIREDFSVTRREKPRYSELDFARAENYWSVICQNNEYFKFLDYSKPLLEELGMKLADTKLLTKKMVASLLPNYITIESFAEEQNINGWIYEQNGKNTPPKLALRWCGQRLNFYTASVTRYQVDQSGKRGNRQALCPYCPYSKGMNLSTIFYGTTDSAYMHHLTKDHGVYSAGYEMPIPVVCQSAHVHEHAHDNEHQNFGVFCTKCRKVVSNISMADAKKVDLNNCLISYNRHCFEEHNIKKQNRSAAEKLLDAKFFGYKGEFLYESLSA